MVSPVLKEARRSGVTCHWLGFGHARQRSTSLRTALMTTLGRLLLRSIRLFRKHQFLCHECSASWAGFGVMFRLRRVDDLRVVGRLKLPVLGGA